MTPGETGILRLPRELDIKAASPLAAELLGQRGNQLTIDASLVERVGAQCLQVLLSAAATWQSDGLDLELAEPSPAFVDAIQAAGLGIETFTARSH